MQKSTRVMMTAFGVGLLSANGVSSQEATDGGDSIFAPKTFSRFVVEIPASDIARNAQGRNVAVEFFAAHDGEVSSVRLFDVNPLEDKEVSMRAAPGCWVYVNHTWVNFCGLSLPLPIEVNISPEPQRDRSMEFLLSVNPVGKPKISYGSVAEFTAEGVATTAPSK